MGMARDQYYFEGATGGEVTGPFHFERDCDNLEGSIRPIHSGVIDLDEVELCPDCVPLDSESDSESEGLVGEFDPVEHTVSEIEEHVDSIDGDSIESELKAIREREVETKNRETALEVIDSRLD